MMNSSIRDILAINISELSKDQLANIEQKLMQSNPKLPVLLAENLITEPQHCYFLEKLRTMGKDRAERWKDATSCQKLVLDFICEFYPTTSINYLIKLCRYYLCHDIAIYMENMVNFFIQNKENRTVADELFDSIDERKWFTFTRHLSQRKQPFWLINYQDKHL